ncbi:phosphatase PAP2 family protein [Uliginosibacterium flavum]
MTVLIAGALASGCAGIKENTAPNPALGLFPGLVEGYLAVKDIPDSLALLPPPPAKGSAALALDTEISQRSFSLRDTPRWTQAISDADLRFPHAASTFSCALNAPVSEAETPRLYSLLHRTLTDAGGSTGNAKHYYNRTRPFVINGQPLCTPDDRVSLEHDGSYPSGHTTVGWSWALILAEVSPAQGGAILARGLAFGESRNVCNAHWHSDVVQARSMAAGSVARLHANHAFLADLNAAKAELTSARERGLKPSRDCSAEAAALALQPSLAQ